MQLYIMWILSLFLFNLNIIIDKELNNYTGGNTT